MSETNTKLISPGTEVEYSFHLYHHQQRPGVEPELERPRKMIRRTDTETGTEIESASTAGTTVETGKFTHASDSSMSSENDGPSTCTSSLSVTKTICTVSGTDATSEIDATCTTNRKNSREDESDRRIKRLDRKASLEITTNLLPEAQRDSNAGEKFHDSVNENDNSDRAAPESENTHLILKLTSPEINQKGLCQMPSQSPSQPVSAPTPPLQEVPSPPSSLDPHQCPNDMSPDTYLQQLFEYILSFQPKIRPTLEVSPLCCYEDDPHRPFLPPITEDELANYDTSIVNAVREGDIDTVKSIHTSKGDPSLSCCNRFGESLLHMACRRGYDTIVIYLVTSANVSVRITDDCGRTPLHDALWHRDCQYSIMDLLVRTDPILLLTCDKRGHTPFAYARREHWANWRQFLWDRREHMRRAMNGAEVRLFCKP